MPDFTFTSPEGKSYTVSGPDGATKEQAFGILQQKLAPPAAPEAPAAPPAAPEPTPMLTQVGHAGMDVAGQVSRAVGDVYGAGKNIVQGTANDPTETGDKFAAPFQHAPDVPNAVERGVGTVLEHTPGAYLAHGVGAAVDAVKGTPQYQAAAESPAGRFVGDVAKPVGEIAQGVGDVVGLKAGLSTASEALDTGVNALNKPTVAQANTLKSNPRVGQLRADGFKITGNDMRAVNPSAADSDIHGATSSEPSATDSIQRHNTALSTQQMATDAGLTNTRAIAPDEMQAQIEKNAKVYTDVGKAIGPGRTVTPNLDHDLSLAAPKAATQEAAAANAKLVQVQRDHFAANGFDGPDAVQTVRELRNEAHTRMATNDANDQSLGRTQLGIANAIENEMMRQLPVQSQGLKDMFPAARQQLAKLHELDAVTEGGQVVPAKVLQLKRSGAPLSGGAAATANAADVAPESMSRAGGTPSMQLSAPTHTGVVRDAFNTVKRGAQKIIPGIDPTTDAYQEAHYGPVGGPAATRGATAPPLVTPLNPPVQLTPPPGNVGVPEQGEMFAAPSTPVGRVAPELAAGQGRTSGAGPSKVRSGPSRYGEDLIAGPEDTGLGVGQGKGSPTKDAPKASTTPPKKMTAAEREQWERDAILGHPRRGN